MTKVKLCGMMQDADIAVVNRLKPEYIGFIFWEKSRRAISRETAARFRKALDSSILAVGVFVNAPVTQVAELLNSGIIDIAQLHGQEDVSYLQELRAAMTAPHPVFQAFRMRTPEDAARAASSTAEQILLDAGTGGGTTFDWSLLKGMTRPYFLAGGLHLGNLQEALRTVHPYGVDVSSGIETEQAKDPEKMAEFMRIVRAYDAADRAAQQDRADRTAADSI